MVKKVTKYETEDGEQFDSLQEAKEWEQRGRREKWCGGWVTANGSAELGRVNPAELEEFAQAYLRTFVEGQGSGK